MISVAAAIILGLASVLTGGLSLGSAFVNRAAEKEKNETNLALNEQNNLLQQQLQEATNQAQISRDREANETTRYLAEHAHQIEMADLEAAGLNPILAAQGGQGASVPTQVVNPLGTANTKAGKVDATPLDLSGLTNVVQSFTSMMLVSALMNSGKTVDNSVPMKNGKINWDKMYKGAKSFWEE